MILTPPKILCIKPPIYDRLIAAGLHFDPRATIFTYGDAIYNPADLDITPDLIAHEITHMRQQREIDGGPNAWWERYLNDPAFRVDQEVEAYRVQYRYICSKKKSRMRQLQVLANIGDALGGPTYGNAVTPEEAIRMIQSL